MIQHYDWQGYLSEKNTPLFLIQWNKCKSGPSTTMAELPQRNTPSNPVVEVATSRVQMHLLVPNLVIELQVRPCSCHATAKEHTFSLHGIEVGCFRIQKLLPLPYLAIELQVKPHRGTHLLPLYSRSSKLQSTWAPSTAKSSCRTLSEPLP